VSFTVNSLQSAKNCYMEILELWREHKFVIVTIKKETRLSIQNRWIQQCYTMVSKQSGNTRPKIVNRCKYDFGLPILMIERSEMAVRWRKMLAALTRDEKREAMDDFPVTRLFNPQECSDYIEQLIMEYGSEYELPEKNWRDKK
jgi:hypothetical protein